MMEQLCKKTQKAVPLTMRTGFSGKSQNKARSPGILQDSMSLSAKSQKGNLCVCQEKNTAKGGEKCS
ncbi:MAG: hypothetical protein LUG17_02770, partial [Clostridiales bacterium]|nr:hypothetical protein [Clostridiales bacterium]